MDILIDTHIFIWASQNDSQLSQTAKEELQNPLNEIYLSAASIWEMSIKVGIGKLVLLEPLARYLENAILDGYKILPVNENHALFVANLPYPSSSHKDPFDRMLIAQAIKENFSFISADKAFDFYGVKRIW
ncbi:MAG: type II toxin-antitoxin system VapC family toxin [Bacteroidia bacterium]|nr:type II toxin-antitoxin system VapC family toxin [Bacteroidia bacterium]